MKVIRDIHERLENLAASGDDCGWLGSTECADLIRVTEDLERELDSLDREGDVVESLKKRCDALEAISAAMLQRWAVIHNLSRAEGAEEQCAASVAAVASLSADEFIADGARSGGARLMRQESAARLLIEVAQHLRVASIEPGSQLAQQIQTAAQQLSSYPQLSPVVVRNPVDVPAEGLEPGAIVAAEKK